jgi:hypothetical protein
LEGCPANHAALFFAMADLSGPFIHWRELLGLKYRIAETGIS